MTHTMTLTLPERFQTLNLLPTSGSYALVRVLTDARMALAPSAEEIEAAGITEALGRVAWTNAEAVEPKDVEIPGVLFDAIAERLRELDAECELDVAQVGVYEMFVPGT